MNINGWLNFETEDHGDGSFTLTATPKRFYWLHLSFWLMVIRSRSFLPTARKLDE